MKLELCIVLALLLIVSLCAAGCNEAQQSPKVWGQGEPTTEWQGFFGTDNMARLNFVQTNRINRMGQAIAELAERVRKLEAATNNVDPNVGK